MKLYIILGETYNGQSFAIQGVYADSFIAAGVLENIQQQIKEYDLFWDDFMSVQEDYDRLYDEKMPTELMEPYWERQPEEPEFRDIWLEEREVIK